MTIEENYLRAIDAIRHCAIKYGRNPDDITLLAVSKNHEVNKILEAANCGAKFFGESKVQEALPKIQIVKDKYPEATFHFVGKLQTNKVKKIVENFSLIHSVDKLDVALAIEKAASNIGKIQNILIQLNLASEPQKNGIEEDNLSDFMENLVKFKSIKLKGFMFIPPLEEEPENNRKYFRKAKEIFLKYEKNRNFDIDTLSMGMSGDFETAVSEGSTMVRIGTMIFGQR